MSASEPFTFISGEHHPRLSDNYEKSLSGQVLSLQAVLLQALRRQNPELIVTITIITAAQPGGAAAMA